MDLSHLTLPAVCGTVTERASTPGGLPHYRALLSGSSVFRNQLASWYHGQISVPDGSFQPIEGEDVKTFRDLVVS
jgi:hypothetical protein